MSELVYDCLVIGAGPGGMRAAMEAARSGLSTALVEQGDLGGTCLNQGCIPTKLFLGATAAKPMLETQQKLKTGSGEVHFDLTAIQQRKERFLKGSRTAVSKQLQTLGVALHTGTARFTGTNALTVAHADGTETTLAFTHAIVATGSMPAAFPGLEPDGEAVLHSTHALALATAPASLLIVGAGAIGLEMGDFFSRLGTAITLVEGMDTLAPTEDPDIGDALRKHLKREGWSIHTGRKVASLRTENGKAVLTFADGETLTADKALMAAGRKPCSASLHPETAGMTTVGAGWIQTNAHLMATPSIYAVGDVNGRTLLAHAADHQARYVVRHMKGTTKIPYASGPMPACIYGHTEVMRVGPTTAELQKAGRKVEVSSAQLIANPIAQSYGTTHGFVKVLWAENRMVGIAAVGHGVSHLVSVATIMVSRAWRVEDVHGIVWAHPTLDEALGMAATAPRTPA